MDFDPSLRPLQPFQQDGDPRVQQPARSRSVRKSRSLKNLFAKPAASPQPAVTIPHRPSTAGRFPVRATTEPFLSTSARIPPSLATTRTEEQASDPKLPSMPSGSRAEASGASGLAPKRHQHTRSISVDGGIPRHPHRISSLAPRPARDDDVARAVVRELHQHAKDLTKDREVKTERVKVVVSKEPHARTLSNGSVVLGDEPQPQSGPPQSPRYSALSVPHQRVRNFSRPSGELRRTVAPEDSTQSSSPRYSTRPPVSLTRKQSHDTVVARKPSQTRDTTSDGSAKTVVRRPSTACSDSRPRPSTSHEPSKPALKRKSSLNRIGDGALEVERVTWKTPMKDNEVRDSMKSGWSALSSASTKRSSVFTKMSSVRDSTTTAEMSDNEMGKGSAAADHAMDLHLRTYEDDARDSHRIRMSFLRGTDIELRSTEIASAMNESIGPAVPSQRTEPDQREPSPRLKALQTTFPDPPPLQEPSITYDQYGFRKATREVTISDYTAWNKEYCKAQNRRTARWMSVMKTEGLPTKDPVNFPLRSEKIQRYVRKGVPPEWRGNMWFFYAGGQAYMDKFPGLYARLVAQSREPWLSENDKEAIDRDINRTFPDNIHFKPDPPLPNGEEASMLVSLRRILYAFAVHHPKIGYCQSLNFLAGMLLLFLNEEKAFWMLHIITSRYLPGTHEISLEGANVDVWVLMLGLKDELPKLWTKVGGEAITTPSRLPPVSLCTTPWFMSLFIGILPVETVLRVWDTIFYDGSAAIFRAALAIFRLGEPDILRVQDPMEIFQVVQTVPRKMLNAGALAATASRRGGVSSAWVESMRREKKDFYARERAAERARKKSGELGLPDRDAQILLTPGAEKAVMNLPVAAKSAGDLTRRRSKGVLVKRHPSVKR